MNLAIGDLRIADARYRLAYTQSRAAMIDLERGRFDSARARGREALKCAELLQRPTEMLIAHLALFRAAEVSGDAPAVKSERAAMTALCEQGVAAWARQQARDAMAGTSTEGEA